MNSLLLALVTVALVALWLVIGRSMRRGARPTVFGFAVSLTGLLCGMATSLAIGKPVFEPTAGLLGVAGGISFSLGFCVLIFRALEIGPTGPTATLNNLALVWPVLIGLLFFSDHPPGLLVWLGLSSTLATLVLMGWQRAEPGHSTSSRWFLMALGGFFLAGINGVAQLLAARWTPGNGLAFCNAMFATSAVMLGILNARARTFAPNRADLLGGMASGALFSLIVIPLSIVLQERLPAHIVLPLTQAGSLILVVLIGRFFLNERLSAAKWSACAAGVAAIACLTI